MQDITLSPGAVAAVTALLGGLVTAIGVIFYSSRSREKELTNDLIKSKDEQIKREQDLTNRLLPAVEEGNRLLQRLVETIQNLQRDWPARESSSIRRKLPG